MDLIGARRFEIFDRVLGRFTPGRLVDLGTGHGMFANRAADRGWTVTGVDARATRFPQDSRIQWIEQDIRAHDLSGYDLILCLGLFYHLDVPDQLQMLANGKGTPLILDTHVANGRHQHKLSREKRFRVSAGGGTQSPAG